MKRRDFLLASAAAGVAILAPRFAVAQGAAAAGYSRLLVLVELKGGNDGLNTVVPYADPAYYSLRPRIAIRRDDVLQLDDRTGLHPSLAPLMPLWQSRELAIVQGIGYPSPNLSHFRSIEIWDTASRAEEYLTDGWLARAFAAAPVPKRFAADGVVVGRKRARAARRRRGARGRARQHRAVPSPGEARAAHPGAGQPRARAPAQGGGGRRTGGRRV